MLEPGMESGPCASPPSEPCQARKGAALRRITASAAGRLGSMAGSLASGGPARGRGGPGPVRTCGPDGQVAGASPWGREKSGAGAAGRWVGGTGAGWKKRFPQRSVRGGSLRPEGEGMAGSTPGRDAAPGPEGRSGPPASCGVPIWARCGAWRSSRGGPELTGRSLSPSVSAGSRGSRTRRSR